MYEIQKHTKHSLQQWKKKTHDRYLGTGRDRVTMLYFTKENTTLWAMPRPPKDRVRCFMYSFFFVFWPAPFLFGIRCLTGSGSWPAEGDHTTIGIDLTYSGTE